MKKLPKDVELPDKEAMLEYLNGQETEVKRMNFQALFNLEVQNRRLERAKKEERFEDAGAIGDEIKKTKQALEGNTEYLEEVAKMRKVI